MKKNKPKKEFKNEISTEPLWTVEEVANYLRLKTENVRVMARQQKIPSVKVGKAWRFRADDIKGWLKQPEDHPEDQA